MRYLTYILSILLVLLSFIGSVKASFVGVGVSPSIVATQGVLGSGSGNLDSVVSGVVFEVDATNEDSYDGTGTVWYNLTETPADGADQSDYDFNFATDNTTAYYPSFTGTAGDSGAYFEMLGTSVSGEGFSYFQTTASGSGLPTFAQQLHQSVEESIWMVWVINFDGTNRTAFFRQRALVIQPPEYIATLIKIVPIIFN